MPEHTVLALINFMEMENSFGKVCNLLHTTMKRSGSTIGSILKVGLNQLENIISNAQELGVKVSVFIVL